MLLHQALLRRPPPTAAPRTTGRSSGCPPGTGAGSSATSTRCRSRRSPAGRRSPSAASGCRGCRRCRPSACSRSSPARAAAAGRPELVSTLADLLDEPGALQLPPGDVDRHGERPLGRGRQPLGGLDAGGRAARSSRASWIRPVCSAIGMKTVGGTSPRTGWCHRSSASTPHHVARPERVGRLVVHVQLAAPHRLAQVGLQLEPVDQRAVHAAGRTARTAARRRALARYIARSALRISWLASASASSRRRRRPADGAMPMLAWTNSSRPSMTNGSCSASRIRSASSAGARQPTPLSTSTANSSPPSRATVSPCADTQVRSRPRHLHQQLVAAGVAQAVVDLLEPVQVEEQHGDRARRRRRAAAGRARPGRGTARGWPAR